ncbi:MAG: hypothetical protein KTR28_06365 [Micavibrio sp.]|nr:hypothetical protein [Micavibrio sp.]
MSDVNANDLRLIDGTDDVLHLYQGAGNAMKTGLEIELAFFESGDPNLSPMSISLNKALKNASNDACGGPFARNEPTAETLEIGSVAGGVNDLKMILDSAQKHVNCLSNKALKLGLKRSYFQHFPEKTAAQLLTNVMDVPRYQAFFAPPRDDMQAIAAYFSVCKSNQVSVSYADPEHLLKNMRRLYALAPFLILLTGNEAPFNEGQYFTGSAALHHREALKDRGGVPPYLFTAQSGQNYIRAHIDHVMNNPLFVYYDLDGNLQKLPTGQWESFNSLRRKGLNTATNYYFAQSILWPDVKIAALKDENENVTGHRYEARMFGVGMNQHKAAQIITAALAFDEDTAVLIDILLKKYGFDLASPESLKAPLEAAYRNATHHNLRFLDISFGKGTMKDFAREFLAILERSCILNGLDEEFSPLQTICESGYTDSHVNALMFGTLDKALDFQRTYNPDIFHDGNSSAYSLFKNRLEGSIRPITAPANLID